jgi:hypothetical protein
MISKIFNALKTNKQRKQTKKAFENAYLDFMSNPKRCTDQSAQSILRKAFVRCGREPLLWACGVQSQKSAHTPESATSKHFPFLNEDGIKTAVDALNKDGCYIMPWRMSEPWLAAVKQKAGEYKVRSREDVNDVQIARSIEPKSHTYWHDNDILNISELKDLVLDEGIKEIIARYLGCTPVLDTIATWWTFPYGEASSGSAQLYHFDLDRIKWLKVFVYLNDVGLDNGPHAFVKGSHLNVEKKIGRDGRYSDEDVFAVYPREDEIVFTGPAGTVIIEDTLGLHKGVPAQKGHRFIFQYDYSINHFGYPYPEVQL